MSTSRKSLFLEQARKKILILDGAIGTELLNLNLTEGDFRSDRFRHNQKSLLNNLDILSLTQPEHVANVHRSYLDAGADIVSTNSFRSNYSAQATHGTQKLIYEMNEAAASIARAEADRMSQRTVDRPRFVAGVMGPFEKWDDEAHRSLQAQVDGLLDGGADLLIAESLCYGESTRPMLIALGEILLKKDDQPLLWVSFAVTNNFDSEKILSEIEFLVGSDLKERPDIIGLNCVPADKIPATLLLEIASIPDVLVSCHPSAGLLDTSMQYPVAEDQFAQYTAAFAQRGLFNIVGGCCGTTPSYIQYLSNGVSALEPRLFRR